MNIVVGLSPDADVRECYKFLLLSPTEVRDHARDTILRTKYHKHLWIIKEDMSLDSRRRQCYRIWD